MCYLYYRYNLYSVSIIENINVLHVFVLVVIIWYAVW